MKRKRQIRDCDECLEKIDELLTEYQCKIEFDEEMKTVILVDKDSNDFAEIDS